MATRLLGFGYKRRQGKDSAAKFIVEEFSHLYDIRKYAFADALKMELHDAYQHPGHPYWEFIGHRAADRVYTVSQNPSVGEVLRWYEEYRVELRKDAQLYGTEYRRNQDPWYWIKELAATIREEQPQFALITDMRFKNEVGWVRGNGGAAVKVQRLHYQHADGDAAGAHSSENELDDVMFDTDILHKEGELDDLKDGALAVFSKFARWNSPRAIKEASHADQG